jgi:hypothetical protein
MTHEFEIKSYRRGQLVMHTWHTDRTSCWIEVQAYRARMRRGEISKIEVYDVNKMTVETIYPDPDKSEAPDEKTPDG